MQNITENSRIYLSGGGNEQQSFPLDNFFFSTLSKNGRFLYIPIALRGHKLYPTAHLWMESILKLHERTDVQFDVMDDPAKYKSDYLKGFAAIYIGGGNTWSLMQELKNSGFTDSLLKYAEEGQIYGGSAGAIILGKRIDTHDDENKVGLSDTGGLGLLGDYSVACHFNNDQQERFQSWAVSNNLPLICLPEEAGLIIDSGIARCEGTKPCTIYAADGVETNINSGESFSL